MFRFTRAHVLAASVATKALGPEKTLLLVDIHGTPLGFHQNLDRRERQATQALAAPSEALIAKSVHPASHQLVIARELVYVTLSGAQLTALGASHHELMDRHEPLH